MDTLSPSERVSAGKTIWVFTPSRTDTRYLESIFVQRKSLLEDTVERVRESALTNQKHHQLFVGPRGCGKTHLVTLIISRLCDDQSLDDHLRIAWLNEDETCTSLLEFLIKIYSASEKYYPNEFPGDSLFPAYDLSPDDALGFVSNCLLSAIGSKTLLIVTENLDAIFDDLGDEGQKQLRAFIQENPKFTIVATAQRLVQGLSKRDTPFFGFFQTEHLKPLNVDEANELLQNIARLQGKDEVVEFLSHNQGRSRIRALHHLSGGNHRIYIVLSQFITRDSIDALLEPFLKMVDELTPYYQERIRWLPSQQRKIMEYLCVCDRTVPVKEIAKRLFASQQTISSQLQDLREMGYVEASQRGRESLYEISEPMMRICVEVKENKTNQPIQLLIDFLRVWYDEQDLGKHKEKIGVNTQAHQYLEAAIAKNQYDGSLRKNLLLRDIEMFPQQQMALEKQQFLTEFCKYLPESASLAASCLFEGKKDEARQCLDESVTEESEASTKASLLLFQAILFDIPEERGEAIKDYTKVIEFADASIGQVALALYSRGVAYGQLGGIQQAINDYTKVIELTGAPIEQVAWALNNRGSAYGQLGKSQLEIDDYTKIIELKGAPIEQVAWALNNRGVAYGQLGKSQLEIDDYTRAIELTDAPIDLVARALNNRGGAYAQSAETQKAIDDFTKVIELTGAPTDQVVWALNNRGVVYGQLGKSQLEIDDYTGAIELADAPIDLVAQAFNNRGVVYSQFEKSQQAINDYTKVIELTDAPIDLIAQALNNRGSVYGLLGKSQLEIDDYTKVIELANASIDQFTRALNNRGVAYGQLGEIQQAIQDLTSVIQLIDAPIDQVARALYNRAFAYGKLQKSQLEIDDYTRVIALPSTAADVVAWALNNRGHIYDRLGETQKAINDLTSLIELPDASIDLTARALCNRGFVYGKLGEVEQAINDFTKVVELTDAPTELVARALNNRGLVYGKLGKTEQAIQDLTSVIKLIDAPVDQVAQALYNRGVAFGRSGETSLSINDYTEVVQLPNAPVENVVDATIRLASLSFNEARWTEGFQLLKNGLAHGIRVQPAYYGNSSDLIEIIFSAGLSPENRCKRIKGLLYLYGENQALAVLGDTVVRHIGNVFRNNKPFPSTDNLEGWASAWEQAAENLPEFRLSVRLLRTGVEYLKTEGENPGILLDLTAPERSILEQAFGLTTETE